MRAARLLVLCLAGLVASQSSNSNPPVSTSLSTSVGLDSNRQTTTQVITNFVTLQSAPTSSSTPTGGGGGGGGNSSSSAPGNATAPSSSGNTTTPNATTTSSTTPSNLPTANPSVDGGGNPAGAPSPGGGNGAYGPGDGYVAGALLVKVNAALVVATGVAVGFAVLL